MSTSTKLAAAALAGLFTVGVMGAGVAQANDHAGKPEKSSAQSPNAEKHACKGKNACKGQGADGKNSCKGKGSCATDGSKPK